MNKSSKISVGGQALIEGIMMRKKNTISMAVRLLNGEIDIETFKIDFLEKIKWYRKIPILRGIIEMIVSFAVGYKCLLKSAEKLGLDENENEKEKSEKNSKFFNFLGLLSAFFGVFLTIAIFMFLPSFAVKNISKFLFFNNFFKVLLEGLIKILIFILYILFISKLKDIKKTFQYHGAEHKAIFCFEYGLNLTVENVKKQKRFHPRCGTNFIFIVLAVSIFMFSILSWKNLFFRVILKFLMLPLVTGFSYEIIKIAGKDESKLAKIFVAPGLMLQRITTKEPDDKQIEVAIAALKEALKN